MRKEIKMCEICGCPQVSCYGEKYHKTILELAERNAPKQPIFPPAKWDKVLRAYVYEKTK